MDVGGAAAWLRVEELIFFGFFGYYAEHKSAPPRPLNAPSPPFVPSKKILIFFFQSAITQLIDNTLHR
jgi:hypothetical protein